MNQIVLFAAIKNCTKILKIVTSCLDDGGQVFFEMNEFIPQSWDGGDIASTQWQD